MGRKNKSSKFNKKSKSQLGEFVSNRINDSAITDQGRTEEEEDYDEDSTNESLFIRNTTNIKKKGKSKRKKSEGKICHLFKLPDDLLFIFLSELDPKSLKMISITCKKFYQLIYQHDDNENENERIWKKCYLNTFFGLNDQREYESKVLIQSCLGMRIGMEGERKWRWRWKNETLNRQRMLRRWSESESKPNIYHPACGRIEALSLSYPPWQPPEPIQFDDTSNTLVTGSFKYTSITKKPSTKISHKQQYLTSLATSTRQPPYILTGGLAVGGVVKSHPMSGKVSKRFWNPGKEANIHLRPHLDHTNLPTSMFMPSRSQTHVLWGSNSGTCIYTEMQSSKQSGPTSINIVSRLEDSHIGPITDIWSSERSTAPHRWVTGGQFGQVKYWQLVTHEQINPTGEQIKKNKSTASEIICLFTSNIESEPLTNRSDRVKTRQSERPDPIFLVRCDACHGVLCGVTKDGDLRVWFNVLKTPQMVRIDVGSEEDMGEIDHMDFEVRTDGKEMVASTLIHHKRSSTFERYTIRLNPDGTNRISSKSYGTMSDNPLTALCAYINPIYPIARSSSQDLQDVDTLTATDSTNDHGYGRLVIAGDENGMATIWAWDGEESEEGYVKPIRHWPATSGHIVTVTLNCGLAAVANVDGHIKIYDVYWPLPTILRAFHQVSNFSKLSPHEKMLVLVGDPEGLHYTINRIELEDDLIIATVGHKIFAWQASITSMKQKHKHKQQSNEEKLKSKSIAKAMYPELGFSKGKRIEELMDLEDCSLQPTSTALSQQLSAMENLGLADGDDALNYALAMSMSLQDHDPAEEEAIAAVRRYEAEEKEMEMIIETIRQSEHDESF